MSEIDYKLREIIFQSFEAGIDAGRNHYMEGEPHKIPLREDTKIAQIKQTFAVERIIFADGAYRRVDEATEIAQEMMTGAEWFKRFEAELFKQQLLGGKGLLETENPAILQAARRAAGLETERRG